MASLIAGSKMWQTLVLLSFAYSTAFFKFVVAGNSQHGQITGTIKFSPALGAPLPSFQSPLNYPAGNLGEKTFEVPITYNKHGNQFERQYASSDNCPQIESLNNILVHLKRLLNQDENNYILQPDQRIHILKSLREYLEKSGSQISEVENGLKLKELIARTGKTVLVDNNVAPQSLNDINKKDHVEANVMLKYDIPVTNNVDCKETLAALIKTVNEAYMQVVNYCTHWGNCKLESEQDSFNIQHSDKPNTVLALGYSVPAQTKITLSNPSLSNIYDIERPINNFTNTNNQELRQKSLSEYYNPRLLSDLIGNQYLTTNSLNSGTVQSQNDQEKNVNINFNKEASQSNIQYSDKSNALKLNNLVSFYNPIPTQVHITPDNQNLWNIYNSQSPVKNLVAVPQNQVDLTQRLSNGYLNYPVQRQTHLDTSNLISNIAQHWNKGVIQTNSKQTENFDISNNKYLNIFKNNDLKNLLNTPKIVNNQYNPIPILQTQNVERFTLPSNNNYPNQELYKVSRVFNDNKASVATLNQNNHNIKEQIQFVRGVIPSYEFHNINYPSYIKPYQNTGLVSPTFYPLANMKQSPYLTSVNLNRQNSLNYNSQKADATVRSNYGINLDAPTTLLDYPKHNIYGNTLFDFNRLASTPNLDKLNAVADNNGVVELIYKLTRPQSLSYNPYYYIKFRIPYRSYISKITDMFKNPYMRSNPLKLQEELAISNFAEASSNIKNIEQDKMSRLILNNGGTLVNAEVVGSTSDSDANEFLQTIQNLNGNLNTNEILNVVENGRTSQQATQLDLGVPVLTTQDNGGQLTYQAVKQQYIDDGIPRSSSPLANRTATPLTFTFLPSKVASQSQLLWNEKPVSVFANLT